MSNKVIKEILFSKKNNIEKCNILCIGDIILDHYIYGRVEFIDILDGFSTTNVIKNSSIQYKVLNENDITIRYNNRSMAEV